MAAPSISALPPILRAVVRALGWARARDWLLVVGGRSVYLPRTISRTASLTTEEVQRLNRTLAQHLSGANTITMPKADKLFLGARNGEIRALRADGVSLSDLSQQYGLTTRQILNICRDCAGGDGVGGAAETQSARDLFSVY